MYVLISCGSAAPSWAVAALCTVSLCVVLSCAVCVWRKCLKKKDKDKEKDRKKGKEKSKADFDTEMNGGYSKVHAERRYHTHIQTHTLRSLPVPCRCIVLAMYQSWHRGHPGVIKLSVFVTGCFVHFSCSCEGWGLRWVCVLEWCAFFGHVGYM